MKEQEKTKRFKKAYAYFEKKILTKLLIVSVTLFCLLSIYAYLETRTNYLNYL